MAEGRSRHGNDVATWLGRPGGRDLEVMSRPSLGRAREGGRDMRPRPGRYARDLRTLSARPVLAARATCTRQACCARNSAHGMGTARAVCARPGFWVCALCTQPSFVTVHCLGVTIWTLFKNTVHRVKKKYKIFKNFIGGDLIYEIFILRLL